MKSYSERGEDIFIDALGILPANGFYVDAGCARPDIGSNSAFLRDRGWIGANIDGNPVYEPAWNGVGPFTCCVLGDGQPVQFGVGGVPELSRKGSGEVMPTRRLDDLLQFSPNVDFLTVDLEGGEFDALQAFDWKKNRPRVICVEYSTWLSGPTPPLDPPLVFIDLAKNAVEDMRVKEFLESMGYKVVHQNVANFIYTL